MFTALNNTRTVLSSSVDARTRHQHNVEIGSTGSVLARADPSPSPIAAGQNLDLTRVRSVDTVVVTIPFWGLVESQVFRREAPSEREC